MIRLVVAAAAVLAAVLALVFTDRTRAAAPAAVRPLIGAHLSPAVIRRVLIPSPAQRKRIVHAHPHFGVYKEAKRRHGVSWFLLAALHARDRSMDGEALLRAARRLRRAGAGPALGRPTAAALAGYYGRSKAGRRTAAEVLAQARMWKQLGIIAPPASDRLVMPVRGVIPACGHFHCPRPGHFHNGIDILAPSGTPIRAMQTGRVAVLRSGGGYGLHVCLQHSSRLASCYAHLSSFAGGLALGRIVTRGEVVGLVGCTGACSGPHLHFEIRRGPARCSACAVDPVPYLEGHVPHVPIPDLRAGVPVVRTVRARPAPAVAPGVPAPAPAPRAPVGPVRAPVPEPSRPEPDPEPLPAPPTGGAETPLPSGPSREPGRTAAPPTGGVTGPPAG